MLRYYQRFAQGGFRRQILQGFMRPFAVIFRQPALGDFPHFIQGSEQIKIQYLCSVGPVKTLNKGILHRFARLNKLQHYAMLFSPLRQSQ